MNPSQAINESSTIKGLDVRELDIDGRELVMSEEDMTEILIARFGADALAKDFFNTMKENNPRELMTILINTADKMH